MRELAPCIKCKTRKYESEVRYDPILKDYICKDVYRCSEKEKELFKVRRPRMGTVKYPTYKGNLQ